MSIPVDEDQQLANVKAVLKRLQSLSVEPETAERVAPADGATNAQPVGVARAPDPGLATLRYRNSDGAPPTPVPAAAVESAIIVLPRDGPDPAGARLSNAHSAGGAAIPAWAIALGLVSLATIGVGLVALQFIDRGAPVDQRGKIEIVTTPTAPQPAATASADSRPPVSADRVEPPIAITVPVLDSVAALEEAARHTREGRIRTARTVLLQKADTTVPDVAWALARSFDPTVLAEVPGADAEPDKAEAARWYRSWHARSVEQGLVSDSVSVERLIRSMER